MSEEQAIEAIAGWFNRQDLVNGATGTWKGEWTQPLAVSLLAALRDAGFDIYRPEDAITDDFDGNPITFGWCSKHRDLARRYGDEEGDFHCWWEDTVEASGHHHPSEFIESRLVPVVPKGEG